MHICTIVARNYLAHARVLAESFARHDPGGSCSVLVIDAAPGDPLLAAAPFDALTPADLEIEDFDVMAGIYDVKELSTAVKPALLLHLLAQHDGPVAYLDPDIVIFSSLAELDQLTLRHGLVLTPHTTQPIPADGRRPDQDFILAAGVYNLGFIAVSGSDDVLGLLEWWRRRLLRESLDDVLSNRFVDQRWMDLAPGFISDLLILRDPGYNVAYWNLWERRLGEDDGELTVNGEPLRFFHFSGYVPERPTELSTHQNRIDLRREPLLKGLCDDYRRRLGEAGYDSVSKIPYGLGSLPNGLRLDSGLRKRYRSALVTGEFEGSLFSQGAAEEFTRLIGGDDTVWGVNAIGYFNAEMGVGEAGRQMVSALGAAKIPKVAIPIPSENRQQHAFTGAKAGDARYAVNLICANADMTVELAAQMAPVLAARYSVGLWWWEVHEFPRQWMPAFGYLDEVWVGSRHVEEAVGAVSPIPVKRVRLPVVPGEASDADRKRLGLPGGYVFLFAFDYLSDFERKNPLGSIEAFKRAFEPGSGPQLVIKSMNADRDPANRDRLEAAAAQHSDVVVIDGYLDNRDKNAMIRASDCFVSLHRSEGFGLGLAEAMYFGLPAIATGYSGNLEFMNEDNSYLIGSQQREIDSSSIYSGSWAEPDIDQAAATMRNVFENPEEAGRRAERGRTTIHERHSREAAGRVLSERLDEVRPEAFHRRSGLAPDGNSASMARAAILGGPPDPKRPKGGRLGLAVRRAVLRLIKPHTAHERRVDLLTLNAVEELRVEVGEMRSALEADSEEDAGPDVTPTR